MDCLIVGGGLLGMMSARELAGAGLRVCLVERGECGRESSWAGGGILSPLEPWEMPAAVTRLAAWSQQHYRAMAAALADATGIDAQWTKSGLLALDPGAASLERATAWARAHGTRLELLDAGDIASVEPGCRPARQALWMPEVAQIRNPRLLRALRRALELAGIEVREGTPVTGVAVDGARVRGVRTDTGLIAADRVVIAGGAWSAGLLEPLGIATDIRPVKGQMLMYRTDPGMIHRILLARGHYLVPRRDGHVLVGSTMEETGFDRSTTATARGELAAAAASMVPAIAACPLVRQWAGLRPGSSDGTPTIGAVPGVEGLYLNAGHFRNGVLLAPASARLLADVVLGRRAIVDPQPYALRPD